MKKLITALILILLCASGFGQLPYSMPAAIDTTNLQVYFEQKKDFNLHYYPMDSFSYARKKKMLGRWNYLWTGRTAVMDSNYSGTLFSLFPQAWLQTYQNLNTECYYPAQPASWKALGPFINYYGKDKDFNGNVSAVWVHPSNPDIILIGAHNGGIWKTTNGGLNWVNLTDNSDPLIPGTLGITDIAVDPTNLNRIYAATGYYLSGTSGMSSLEEDGYSLGIIYSNDGGASWQYDNDFKSKVPTDSISPITKLAFQPNTTTLYAIVRKQILVKKGTAGWATLIPPFTSGFSDSKDYKYTDFEFTKATLSNNYHPDKVYFSTNGVNNVNYIFEYHPVNPSLPPGGPVTDWTVHTAGFAGYGGSNLHFVTGIVDFDIYSPDKMTDSLLIGINDLDPKIRIMMCYASMDNIHSAMPTKFNPDNFYNKNNLKTVLINQNNPNICYLIVSNGNVSIGTSYDRCDTIKFSAKTHADGRCIKLYTHGTDSTGLGDKIFLGTDGGLALKDAGQSQYYSLMGDGITITELHGISGSHTNNNILNGAAQDNSQFMYVKYNNDPWRQWSGMDGFHTRFYKDGKNTLVYITQNNIGSPILFTPSGLQYNTIQEPRIFEPEEMNVDSQNLFGRRTLELDNLNRMWKSFHCLWKTHLDTTSWYPAVGLDNEPKNLFTMAQFKKRDTLPWVSVYYNNYKIPKAVFTKDDSIVYIAYLGKSKDTTDIDWNDAMKTKLYYTENANDPGNPTNWIPKQPGIGGTNLTDYFPILDIAVNPQNPAHIWVAFGDIKASELDMPASQRIDRVLYSNNYGNTGSWLDVSKGLPAMPVHKLTYVDGSNDLLFAGTDAGVYKWNKAAAQWECYSQGMPRCIISDMEVNYCSGTLRAGTYGRGAYETKISELHNPHTAVGFTENIANNITWSSSKNIHGSIRIPAGKKLTISGNNTIIYMSQNARILVEMGGELVVDGATLTNSCEGSSWQGIELESNSSAAGNITAQHGKVELKNNATIENAVVGISDYTREGPMQMRGGGIMDIQNARIINCATGIKAHNYTNFDANITLNNVRFILNKDAQSTMTIANDAFCSHININRINNLKVLNCVFKDTRTKGTNGVQDDSLATGIYSMNSNFKVEGCTFDTLYRGIYGITTFMPSGGTLSSGNIIKNNTFSHTSQNITTNAYNNYIRLNNFGSMTHVSKVDGSTTPPTYWAYPAWGIKAENTNGLVISDNIIQGINFTPTYGLHNKYGVVADNTNSFGAYIGNNQFVHLDVALQSENRGHKLSFLCNYFNGNAVAVAVNPQSNNNFFNDQGYCSGSTSFAYPHNTFVNNTGDIYSWSLSWNYFTNSSAPSSLNPSLTSGTVNVTNCTYTPSNYGCQGPPVIIERKAVNNISNPPVLSDLLAYFNNASAVDRNSVDARYYFYEVLHAYEEAKDYSGYMDFLALDNTDESKLIQIPYKIAENDWTTAQTLLSSLTLPSNEVTAYFDYYDLYNTLHTTGRPLDSLNPDEVQLLIDIATADIGPAAPAKAILEHYYGMPWQHTPEELPILPENSIQTPVNKQPIIAIPNPSSDYTQIFVKIDKDALQKQPYVEIRDMQGKLMQQYTLTAVDEVLSINVGSWPSGVYTYTLIIGGSRISTAKLSVSH